MIGFVLTMKSSPIFKRIDEVNEWLSNFVSPLVDISVKRICHRHSFNLFKLFSFLISLIVAIITLILLILFIVNNIDSSNLTVSSKIGIICSIEDYRTQKASKNNALLSIEIGTRKLTCPIFLLLFKWTMNWYLSLCKRFSSFKSSHNTTALNYEILLFLPFMF